MIPRIRTLTIVDDYCLAVEFDGIYKVVYEGYSHAAIV